MHIFDKLTKERITYAVGVYLAKLGNTGLSSQKDRYYCIMVVYDKRKQEANRVLRFEGFQVDSTSGYALQHRELSAREAGLFRNRLDRYNMVVENEHGRVYEMKEASFKAEYNRLRKKLEKQV